MRVLLLFLGLCLAGCSRSETGARDGLPDLRLPTLGGPSGASLAQCPTERCLTVYVAPWCPYCRASTPTIKELRRHLGSAVEVRVIVGMDRAENVRLYAAEFGPATLLDPENAVSVKGGVPHFYVSDRSGRIVNEVPGMPPITQPRELARYFGLDQG